MEEISNKIEEYAEKVVDQVEAIVAKEVLFGNLAQYEHEIKAASNYISDFMTNDFPNIDLDDERSITRALAVLHDNLKTTKVESATMAIASAGTSTDHVFGGNIFQNLMETDPDFCEPIAVLGMKVLVLLTEGVRNVQVLKTIGRQRINYRWWENQLSLTHRKINEHYLACLKDGISR